MSKQRHRRTQSNMELDFKPGELLSKQQLQQLMDISNIPDASRTRNALQHQQEQKEVIIEQLEEDIDLDLQKDACGLNFGKKQRSKNVSNILNAQLFQIPEQNDLISSIECSKAMATTASPKEPVKHKLIQQMASRRNTIDHKENIPPEYKQENRIQSSRPNQAQLFEQIQQMHQALLSEKKYSITSIGSKQKSNTKTLSFTNEIQKKKAAPAITSFLAEQITPDRRRNMSSTFIDKLKKEVPKSSNKTNSESESSRVSTRLTHIEQEIQHLKKRTDRVEDLNRTIQDQILILLNESRNQRELGHMQLQKIEELDAITRRNEECISVIKNSVLRSRRYDTEKSTAYQLK